MRHVGSAERFRKTERSDLLLYAKRILLGEIRSRYHRTSVGFFVAVRSCFKYTSPFDDSRAGVDYHWVGNLAGKDRCVIAYIRKSLRLSIAGISCCVEHIVSFQFRLRCYADNAKKKGAVRLCCEFSGI